MQYLVSGIGFLIMVQSAVILSICWKAQTAKAIEWKQGAKWN